MKGSCSSDQLKPEPPTLPGSYAFHPEVFCLLVLFLGLPAFIGHHCKACNRPSRQGSSATQTPSLNKCLLTLDPSQGSSTGPVPRPQLVLEVSVRIANEGQLMAERLLRHRREGAPGSRGKHRRKKVKMFQRCCLLVTELLCGSFETEPGWRPRTLRFRGVLI